MAGNSMFAVDCFGEVNWAGAAFTAEWRHVLHLRLHRLGRRRFG